MIDAIMKLSGFVLQQADNIEELDINPLIVCARDKSVWMADALLIMQQPTSELAESNNV